MNFTFPCWPTPSPSDFDGSTRQAFPIPPTPPVILRPAILHSEFPLSHGNHHCFVSPSPSFPTFPSLSRSGFRQDDVGPAFRSMHPPSLCTFDCGKNICPRPRQVSPRGPLAPPSSSRLFLRFDQHPLVLSKNRIDNSLLRLCAFLCDCIFSLSNPTHVCSSFYSVSGAYQLERHGYFSFAHHRMIPTNIRL